MVFTFFWFFSNGGAGTGSLAEDHLPTQGKRNRPPLSRQSVAPGKLRGDHGVMVAQGRDYFNMEDVKGL
jgi:hypothetical protein